MSGKPCGFGFEGSIGSPGEDVPLPYPETSALPDVGKIMKDLGIDSTIPHGIPESSSADVSLRPGGLGFESFFGRPSEDAGFPSCQTSGEFPNVEKIMKDLSIESPVSERIPDNIPAASNVLDSPSHSLGFGFKVEVLSENQDPQKNKKLCDAASSTSEKKADLDDPTKKPEIGKPS
ncbi:uncharacterized protein ACMZJ9_017089 [Mantella aurantiaca]